MPRVFVQWCFVVFVLAVLDVQAHDATSPPRDALSHAPKQPAPAAPDERVTGWVHRLVVDDRVAGITSTEYSARLDDGSGVALRGIVDPALATGDRIQATGRRNGSALFVSAMSWERASSGPPAQRRELRGKLALLHADYFDDDKGEFILAVEDEAGDATPLALPRIPESLDRGMQVTVSGTLASDGVALVPDEITIESLGSGISKTMAAAGVVTDKVLVILMRFNDSPAIPFTQAQVQSEFAGGAGSASVAQFFSEASFGLQLLAPTVTAWLPTNVATPAGCNWSQMASLGRTAATNAGYAVSTYQKLVYVFPRVSSCGWAGLGYVGASGAWINGYNTTKVYGHELGHNFGLLHAASLRCSGGPIGGSCAASEYGDPFDMMGNQRAMHFNAPQKWDLGWIPAGSVATHTSGQTNYVLNPLELSGGSLYAVKVPVATNRTYWIEYRQPIGFDTPLSAYPNNGAQVRVASPFETLCGGCDAWSNDTQLLDMTPATSAFTDAALVVGQRYTDATYGVTFEVLGATATALTVKVTRGAIGPGPTTTTLVSAANPSTAGTIVTFTASVTGSAPTGTVAFTDSGAPIGGCGAVALTGTGNTRTATCATSAMTVGTHAVSARYAGDAGNAASSSAVLSQSVVASPENSNVWVEDNVPTGATYGGNVDTWTWVSSNPAPFSGTRAHQSALASGMHQHYFFGAAATMAVKAGDTLYAYVFLDPANPPSEVMLQWNVGNWEHRAYWGANLVGLGVDGTVSRRFMGPLPPTGQWVRLAVPASAVGLEGSVVNGMAFTVYNGRATWDQAGRIPGATSTTAWVEDNVPTGATYSGNVDTWTWVSSNPAPFSGTRAHQSALASGMHQHYFFGAAATMAVKAGDTLYAYVYLDPANPPSEVMLQWNVGNWEQRAYWGANLIGLGLDGTVSRRFMGPLPPTGQWVRLAVPASAVGLEGRVVNGMAFTLYNGRATWDQAGKF